MQFRFENRQKQFTATNLTKVPLSPIPHIHPHIELVYLAEGSSIAIIDNKEYPFEQGSFCLSFPNQIHFYHDQSPIKRYVIIFSSNFLMELGDIFMQKIPSSPIIKLKHTRVTIEKTLYQLYEKGLSQEPLDKICAKGLLLTLLCDLLSSCTLTDAPIANDSIKNVLLFCLANYTEPITLDILARELHMSPNYISRIFSKKLHISFTDFINNLRLEYACSLLGKSATITEIALSSGFNSVRTFNRVFLRNMNMTPREYIKLNL